MAKHHKLIEKLDKYIGHKISIVRLAKALSRKELAEIVGVTHQQLYKYEKGTNRISAGRLLLIANALDKNISYFYTGFEEVAQFQNQDTNDHRLCLEVSKNFMKLKNPEHQFVVNTLMKTLIKNSE